MQRIRQTLLPILIVGCVVGTIAGYSFYQVYRKYQQTSYQETAALLGAVASANIEDAEGSASTNPSTDDGGRTNIVDATALIANLRSPNSEQVAVGETILRQSGYFADELTAPSGQKLLAATGVIVVLSLSSTLVLIAIYTWWRDSRRRQQILCLTKYIHNLSERIYDLKLVENSEDEMSLLSNELYKITVALREAAETNHEARTQLESALADISHQLRTPLTSLQLTLDNLIDDTGMPIDLRQDFLRSAARQVNSMSSLVTTLLNLAKFDNGSIKLQSHKVKIGQVLAEVIDSLLILAELQEVELELTGDLDATISLDARWQREALANIVKNCIEHSPAQVKVQIKVIANPLFIRIVISDQGEGISEHDQKHIFERFYKAKNSRAESIGIGLAFAKAIIEANDGQISVKSTPDRGTTFKVTYFR